MSGFTSYDAIIAAISAGKAQDRQFSKALSTNAAGQAVSLWAADGTPAAGGYGTSLVARSCTDETTGAIGWTNPDSDEILQLVAGYAMPSAANIGSLIVYDRLADIAGISVNTNSLQSLTMSALPRYADGAGVMMFLEVVTTSITGTPTFTITYTDQDGNASSVTQTVTCAANADKRFAYSGGPYIPLASGDHGVRSAQSITFTGAGGGQATLVFARPLFAIPLLTAGGVIERDLVTQVPRLPRIYDDACLALFTWGGGTTTGTIAGNLTAVAG